MDSLLASYASSDDEESPPNPQPHKHTNHSSKFSLPPPKSTSSSPFTLPPPKSKLKQPDSDSDNDELHPQKNHQKSKPSSLFSSLPPAKIHVPDPKVGSTSKKVVQFRPPLSFASMKSSNVDDDDDDDDDDEDEEERERKRKKAELAGQTPSVRSFLSSIPAPRNSVTLGVLGSGLGTGRRSVIDADVQGANLVTEIPASEVGVSGSEGELPMGGAIGSVEYATTGENGADFDGYSGYGGGDGNVEYSNSIAASGDYSGNHNDYVNYGDYGQYPNNWIEGSSAAAPEVPIDRALRLPAKRGRKDDPPQFIEVNQDELMKNRPREDQAKMTGIAFGPAYQPASSKGKPTKLHKRKHQIGALYFDMKQKETELAERRSKGFLTKAQTQGKYGW